MLKWVYPPNSPTGYQELPLNPKRMRTFKGQKIKELLFYSERIPCLPWDCQLKDGEGCRSYFHSLEKQLMITTNCSSK
jgi:hypothetical protein